MVTDEIRPKDKTLEQMEEEVLRNGMERFLPGCPGVTRVHLSRVPPDRFE